MLFHKYFGNMSRNLVYIFMGCMWFGFLISYLFVRFANFVTLVTGLKADAVIGLIIGLMNNFFIYSNAGEVINYEKFAVNVAIGIIIGAVIGAVVAVINGALSETVTK